MRPKKYSPENFKEVNPTHLRYSWRPCKRGHVDSNGRTIRYNTEDTTTCVGCKHKLPDGPFDFVFGEGVADAGRPPYTDEERRQRHIQQVVEYNRRRRDLHNERVKRYTSKPEVKERYRERAAKHYQENREEILAKQRKEYKKKRQALTPEEKYERYRAWYLKNREKILASHRARYQARKDELAMIRREKALRNLAARTGRTYEDILKEIEEYENE